jgi:hypothetical protein
LAGTEFSLSPLVGLGSRGAAPIIPVEILIVEEIWVLILARSCQECGNLKTGAAWDCFTSMLYANQ